MDLVVKVKYDTALRRFTVYAREDGTLNLTLAGLRSKICELFHFNLFEQLVITYVDQDNDVVTMEDDNDLLDVLHQGLNPLRLEVSLRSQNNRTIEKQPQSQPSTPRNISIPKEQGQAFDLMQRQQTAEKSSGTQSNNTLTLFNYPVEQHIAVSAQTTSVNRFAPSASPVGEIHDYRLKGNHGFGEHIHRTFHKGIECDGCGMHPIIDTRYKSIVKNDYDLCQSCFSEVGNEEEDMKLDRALYRPPHKERSLHRKRHCHKSPGFYPSKCPALSHYSEDRVLINPWNSPSSIYGAQTPSAGKQTIEASGKLDCRFIQDVGIIDETQLAPETPFTKIWRLRNNGTLNWPHRTQLVRVGGDDFGAEDVVNLEIPEQGYQVDDELDAAVNFLAPIQPGRYVSYWRLMAPTGQKFGQLLWVLIQVVPPREDGLPVFLESKEVEQNNLSQGKTEQNTAVLDVSSQDTSEKPCLGDNKMDLDLNKPGCFPMVVDKGKRPSSPFEMGHVTIKLRVDVPTEVQGASSTNSEAMPSALGAGYSSYAKSGPLHDVSLGHIAVPANAPSLVGSETFFVGKETEDRNAVEQALLHELEDMGFKHRMLNAGLLRKHDYDLEKTLDYLCSAAEWDPTLEELQEMDLHDSEMNRTLLGKNEM